MMEWLTAGALGARAGRAQLFRSTLSITGRTESHVEEATQPIYSRWRAGTPPIETTILAAPGQVELHFTTRADDAVVADEILGRARAEILAVLGADVFSEDGRALEVVVGDLLRQRGLTIAVAESCTGGLLLSRLTDVPGSSAYVRGGVVAYSNELKIDLANVMPALIDSFGAVSEPVATALAEGIRSRTGADVGVGVTGIAGPSGGTPQKPVGTVAAAVAAPEGRSRVRMFSFPGGRAQVKFQATQAALDMVRRALL
jgi:nicotinamide-nucleotide amidase